MLSETKVVIIAIFLKAQDIILKCNQNSEAKP